MRAMTEQVRTTRRTFISVQREKRGRDSAQAVVKIASLSLRHLGKWALPKGSVDTRAVSPDLRDADLGVARRGTQEYGGSRPGHKQQQCLELPMFVARTA
jgi:hypothetical protein